MEKTLYWLWLTNKQGLSYKGMRDLIEYFGSVDAVYKAESYDELNLNENVRAALKNKHLDKAKTIYDETVRSGGYILTIDDAEYPPMLRTISDPPYVLYCKGLHFDWKNTSPTERASSIINISGLMLELMAKPSLAFMPLE